MGFVTSDGPLVEVEGKLFLSRLYCDNERRDVRGLPKITSHSSFPEAFWRRKESGYGARLPLFRRDFNPDIFYP